MKNGAQRKCLVKFCSQPLRPCRIAGPGQSQGRQRPDIPKGSSPNGNSHQDFSRWLLFMSATTYSPTHFRVQYNRPGGA